MNKLVVVLLFFGLGCSANKSKPDVVRVSFMPGKQSVQITGINAAIVQEINRDSSGGHWQSLLPVYRMPADTDLKNYQPGQPGKYRVKQNAVVFTPDTPFAARQTYFLRYYRFDAGTTIGDYIYRQNKPGSLHYTDLVFN